jgi:hypothetical protein
MRNINSYKIGMIIFCAFVVISISQVVIAHSPSNINLSYNSENQKLITTIDHQVSDPNSHYISNIIIKKNDIIINTSDYTSQPSNTSFTYEYNLDVTVDDIIEVTAKCNRGGSITKQITINGDNGASDGSSTPGFELIIVLCAIGLALFWKIKR